MKINAKQAREVSDKNNEQRKKQNVLDLEKIEKFIELASRNGKYKTNFASVDVLSQNVIDCLRNDLGFKVSRKKSTIIGYFFEYQIEW